MGDPEPDTGGRTSAALNVRMHERGRLSCCPPSGLCPVDSWAKAYLAGQRRPYPLEDVLANLRETEHDSDR